MLFFVIVFEFYYHFGCYRERPSVYMLPSLFFLKRYFIGIVPFDLCAWKGPGRMMVVPSLIKHKLVIKGMLEYCTSTCIRKQTIKPFRKQEQKRNDNENILNIYLHDRWKS